MSAFIICWVITLGMLGWASFMPLPESQDIFGLGTFVSMMFRGLAVLITGLVTWLVYFALLR